MIPMLATIISIYCCLRLIEMGLAAYGRHSKEFTDVSWLLYFGSAFVIAILCLVIVVDALKVAYDLEYQQRLAAQSAERHRELDADLQRFNEDLHKKTEDVPRQLDDLRSKILSGLH